jgi:hypothetical protein
VAVDVYIKGKAVHLSASKSIGKGGEADVFDIGNGVVAKVYKQPDHPDFEGMPHEQEAARWRIELHQTKLRDFPKGLPSRVVAPVDLITDKSGRVCGFTMPFISGGKVLLHYSEKSFRFGGVDNNAVTRIFRDMHSTIAGVHKAGVVIGDFNDLNVLVVGEQAFVIDADSFQFGRYLCQVFTARFVDPLLCDQSASSPTLGKPHTKNSDWYAYAVMLMQSLLLVGPYGGVYKPKNPKKRIAHDARPLHRLTVFDPDVRYPKPATPLHVLPDDLLHHLQAVFMRDVRGEFPAHLLEMQWIACKCGVEFARPSCPACSAPAPGVVKQTMVIRGSVTCTTVFKTSGRILFAAVQNGKLLYLYHENGRFMREDGSVVTHNPVDKLMRFRIQGEATLIAQGHQLITLKPGAPHENTVVDTYDGIPMFDGTERCRYWIESGRLMRDGSVGPEFVGTVLQEQTMFWAGPTFGFGFYRAERLSVAFLFRGVGQGINDAVKIPSIRGQLLNSIAYFGKDRVWFAVSTQDSGVIKNKMFMIKTDGALEASAEATAGDGSWLSEIRGKTAVGSALFSVTDDGIVRVEASGGQIAVVKEFPDTEPFVDSSCHLFPGPGGLYVTTAKEIRLLALK